jgi:hypothetical protein
MKRLSSIVLPILFFCLTAMAVFPAASTCGENDPPTLYIYRAGPAQVDQERVVEPDKTGSAIELKNLPTTLIPQSVWLTEISENKSPDILTRRFRFDLMDKDTLLKALEGLAVDISDSPGTVSGKMLTFPGGYVCAGENAHYIFLNDRMITVKEAESLYLTPTLILKIDPAPDSPTRMRLSYQVRELNWLPSYSLIINPGDSSATLNLYGSLQNLSGFGFDRANVIFMGEPGKSPAKTKTAAAGPSGISLPAPIQVPENIQHIEMLLQSAAGSLVRHFSFEGDKEFFASGAAELSGTTAYIPCTAEFIANPSGDGITEFPPGELSVFNRSSQLQYRGKVNPATLRESAGMSIPLGPTGGLELLRSRIKSKAYDTGETEIAVSYQVRNQKDYPVTIEFLENIPFAWELVEFSHDYEKLSGGKLKFFVKVPPLNMVLIDYRLRIINHKEGETLGGY